MCFRCCFCSFSFGHSYLLNNLPYILVNVAGDAAVMAAASAVTAVFVAAPFVAGAAAAALVAGVASPYFSLICFSTSWKGIGFSDIIKFHRRSRSQKVYRLHRQIRIFIFLLLQVSEVNRISQKKKEEKEIRNSRNRCSGKKLHCSGCQDQQAIRDPARFPELHTQKIKKMSHVFF